MSIADSLKNLKTKIQQTAVLGLDQEPIRLVLVSKTVSIEKIGQAYEAGQRDFGENKIQELLKKTKELPSDIFWHFIGRLQTNKVKYWIELMKARPGKILLQSLDRWDLAKALEKEARKRQVAKIPLLMQINSSGEATKGGFSSEEAVRFAKSLSGDSPFCPQGVMTIGPLTDDSEEIRTAFRLTTRVFQDLKRECPQFEWKTVSMGMSSDFEIALEEGSNMLRIGNAVFGERVDS